MSFIQLDRVYKRYKMGDVTIEAASGMSFEIERGELVVEAGKDQLLGFSAGLFFSPWTDVFQGLAHSQHHGFRA